MSQPSSAEKIALWLGIFAAIAGITGYTLRDWITGPEPEERLAEDTSKRTEKSANLPPSAPSSPSKQKNETDGEQKQADTPSLPSSFFNAEAPTEIAILATGQANGLSISTLKTGLAERLQSKGFAVSTSLFRPDFYSRFGRNLETEDLSALKNAGFGSRCECLCFLKIGNVHTEKESLETGGETHSFEKASGDLEVKFFALRGNSVRSFTISETGTGGNRARALESLNEKLITQFFNLNLPLALCKN